MELYYKTRISPGRVVTEIGNPGSDALIPSEQAVREMEPVNEEDTVLSGTPRIVTVPTTEGDHYYKVYPTKA